MPTLLQNLPDRVRFNNPAAPAYSGRSEGQPQELSEWFARSNFLTIKYGLINVERELTKISELDPDWDSYGAEPPSAESIQAARGTLHQLAESLILPNRIVPSAGGGVSIYFMGNGRSAYIENYNDGAQALVMYDRENTPEVLEVKTDIQASEIGDRLMRYLDQA